MVRAFHRLMVILGILSSTLFAAAPRITSFTPTSGIVGTSVVLTGTNFTGATAVKFNGVAASSYTVTSATKITAVAPTGVTTGKLSVTTSGGTATSTSNFTVSAPTISSFTPTSGTVGTSVTLTGTKFTGATTVKFNGSAASSFIVVSATSITAVTPSGVTTGKISVTTSGGTATSSSSFTVVKPPSITTQPANKTVTLGSTATFSIVASGTAPLTYQWLKNGVAILGATSASYTTAATVTNDNGATFSVRVTNSYGNVTSSAATLTVNLPPTIISQPASKAVDLGATATFSVGATGTGTLTYQWLKNGATISGATSASYTTAATVSGDNGASFKVKVTNSYGNVTSSAATLTVNLPPTITTQPANQSVYVGAAATFSVLASGTGPLTYQWFKNAMVISGANASSYTTPITVLGDNASTFTVNVTSPYGNITSSPSKLTVLIPPPSITTCPANQTAAIGSTATFTVVATGAAPLTYQWSKNATDIPGATSASYTTPSTVATDNYASFTVLVANAGGATSCTATLTLGWPPTITYQPTNGYVFAGNPAWFQVNASGAQPLNYQWFKNGIAIPGATESGYTSTTYTTPPTVVSDNGAVFTVQVTNPYGSITCAPIRLTVLTQAPRVTTQPANQTVTLGATATFTVVAGGTAPLNYQWSKNGTAIPGAIAASYSTPPTVPRDVGSVFSVTILNDYGSVTSSNVGLFLQTPAVQVIPSQTTVSLSGVKQFQALVQSGSVIWSVVETNGGVISQNGTYTAPTIAGTYTIKATSTVDSSLFGLARVVVSATGDKSGPQAGPPITGNPGTTGVSLTLTPGTLQVDAGMPYPFVANVTGSDNQAVTWQVVGNPADSMIDQGGVFVAQRRGLYQVEVISAVDPTATVMAQVSVQSAVHSAGDSPLTGLRGYSMTTLNDGKVLIAGGSTSTDPQVASVGQISSQAYIYDPATQVFTPTGSMLIGRTDHKATLLPDGRVLITSGLGVYQEAYQIHVGSPASLKEVNCAEVYDPNLSAFVNLPSPGSYTVNATPPYQVPWPNGYMYLWLLNRYLWADTLCLSNGDTILLPGAETGGMMSTSDGATHVYSASSRLFINLFDSISSNCGADTYPGLQRHQALGCNGTVLTFNPSTPPKCGAGVILNDGRGIAIGGVDCVPDMDEAHFLWSGSSLAGSALGAWNSVRAYNQAGFSWSVLAPMNVSRGRHTATKLSDGRVLVVGGGTGTSPDPFCRVENISTTINGWRELPLIDTPTAEIYDPVANSWSMVGSLSQSRQGHAAVLLPDGRVMVLGGRHYVQGGYPNSTYTYPNLIEIFDPETNTFSVMDHLDYGLSEPKLALMQDGSVFVAGQVQAPMEAPAAIAQGRTAGANGFMAAAAISSSMTTGSSIFGVISSQWDALGYPEEAALTWDGADLVPATVPLAPVGVRESLAPSNRPSKARISVPLPYEADVSTNPSALVTTSVNARDRFYLLRIKKPNWNFTITGVKVKVNCGTSSQYVLGDASSWQGLSSGVFFRVKTPSDIPMLSGTDDESTRENLRKNWARDWISEANKQGGDIPALGNASYEFYKVMTTFTPETKQASIPFGAAKYGLVGGQVFAPPSDRLSYTFQIQYLDPKGNTQTWDVPVGRVQHNGLDIIAQWNAGQYLTYQWFGDWNDDKWCSKQLITWLQDSGNRQVLGPVNDITLEHGRNTGHHAEHLRGDAMDTYHPGYSALIGPLGANGTPSESGTAFIARVCGLVASAKAGDVGARASLVNWIDQARQDLQAMLERMNDGNNRFVGSGLYLRSIGDGANAQYVDVRNLIWTGQCTGLNLTQDTPSGESIALGVWNWGTKAQRDAITWDNSGNVHTTHIHIRPQGYLATQ